MRQKLLILSACHAAAISVRAQVKVPRPWYMPWASNVTNIAGEDKPMYDRIYMKTFRNILARCEGSAASALRLSSPCCPRCLLAELALSHAQLPLLLLLVVLTLLLSAAAAVGGFRLWALMCHPVGCAGTSTCFCLATR